MKKCLITVQFGLLLAIGSGCVIVPPNPRPVVVHRPPTPPPRVVVVERSRPRPVPPPVVVVETPPPIIPPPIVVVETPKPRHVPPPVVVVETPRPPVVVHARQPTPPPQTVAVKAPHDQWVQVTIQPREREVIREYIVYKRSNGNGNRHDEERYEGKHAGKHDKALPKGIAKKVERGDSLPPGWQKKCVRGQVMPMEVFKHCEPLPHEILVKLPPPPTGTVIVTLEGKAVRLMQATLEILDVFDVI